LNANAAGAYAFEDDNEPKPEPTPAAAPVAAPVVTPAVTNEEIIEPSLGGTLNATTQEAAEDTRREEEADQNKTILTHSYLASSPEGEAVSTTEAAGSSYVLGHDEAEPAAPQTQGHELVIEPPVGTSPVPTPADLGLPMPPSLPDFSAPPAAPAMGSAYAPDPEPSSQPELLGDILAPEPPAAPVTPPPASTPAPTNDPGQFQIPPTQ
jgi:hypothetical protein